MKDLERFESMDFIEQVTLLGSISQGGNAEAVPGIVSLMEKISRNEAIGLVLRDTLKELLSRNEERTAACIFSENQEVKAIAIDVSGQKRFASVAGALLEEAGRALEKKEYGILFVVITALSRIQPPEAFDLFRKCISSEDSLISSQCIEVLGDLKDIASLDTLCSLIAASDTEEAGGECSLPTANAITALGRIGGKEAVSFLVTRLHHNSPAARRFIHEVLAGLGAESVKPLAAVFSQEDVDNRIFAANILGVIGSRDAGDALVRALDKGLAQYPNIRFAVYESLGRIPGMTSLVCLTDGLGESDQMVLMAVISSLDVHLNPWISDKIAEIIRKGDDRSKTLIKAIAASRSLNIFESLYTLDDGIGSAIVDAVGESGDGELVEQFCQKLREMGTDKAKGAAQGLEKKIGKTEGPQVLAVDDSKAMLNFYRSIASSLGLNICTAGNGKEGLDVLSGPESFKLILTDMNMPVMDGIEFTRQIREDPGYACIPIIMITTESEKSQQVIAREAGVTDFLQKPFSVERLQEVMKSYL
jgi:CheY-like chemotaxis protein/HEAT repeat protein